MLSVLSCDSAHLSTPSRDFGENLSRVSEKAALCFLLSSRSSRLHQANITKVKHNLITLVARMIQGQPVTSFNQAVHRTASCQLLIRWHQRECVRSFPDGYPIPRRTGLHLRASPFQASATQRIWPKGIRTAKRSRSFPFTTSSSLSSLSNAASWPTQVHSWPYHQLSCTCDKVPFALPAAALFPCRHPTPTSWSSLHQLHGALNYHHRP